MSARATCQLVLALCLGAVLLIAAPSGAARQQGAGAARPVIAIDAPDAELIDSGTAATRRPRAGELQIFDGARIDGLWGLLLIRARWSGWDGRVKGPVSGIRTYSEQQALHNCYLAGKCAPAFDPAGPSRHLLANVRAAGAWSQAVDVTRARQLVRVAASLGVALHQPYATEPWHVEAGEPFSARRLDIAP